ncbi:C-5 cytosine-specific DNA methylase [bacterium YEK0313]|nr:C-5 cytosine-specific DNA methylase [bacterium YEK0313]
MTPPAVVIPREITHFHMCPGAGGGGKGFNRGGARVGRFEGVPVCIGGIDNDAAGLADFERVTGVQGTLRDLFTVAQYTAFHGRPPPPDFKEVTPDDVRRAAGYRRPNVVFMSTPCKGYSGLLAEQASLSPKYQALNALAQRVVWLVLEAWADDPPEFILFENVPRIMTRGRGFLDQICAMLAPYNFAWVESQHDCGELGGLAQSRKRFLGVARHRGKVPPFLYEPPRQRIRSVGELLEQCPLPGDLSVGPMHRMPNLQWKTWVRLAFVEAGSDWRSLNKLQVEDGVLRDFAIMPDRAWRDGTLGVLPWPASSGAITAQAEATTGRFSVADPRVSSTFEGAGHMGVREWDRPAALITGDARPTKGQFSVADPRPPEGAAHYHQYGVRPWSGSMGAVINVKSPGQGVFSVADPRVDGHPKSVQLGIRRWEEPAPVVKGDVSVGTGPYAVPDPRIPGSPRFNNTYRIVRTGEASPAVAGPGGPANGLCVADPRAAGSFAGNGKYRVTAMTEPAGTVIGGSTTGQGAFAIADPRTGYGPNSHRNKMRVAEWEKSTGTVIGADRVGSGAMSVADPRPEFARDGREQYLSAGHYGVNRWEASSLAVTGTGQHDNGRWSVADPRPAEGAEAGRLPAPEDRLVAVIRALDGTWHRPFTTYELAALQGYVDPGEHLVMQGTSDSAWRERIGNMVPPPAAQAIMSTICRTLLLAWQGETFMLSSDPIWVRPIATALSIDVPPLPEVTQ